MNRVLWYVAICLIAGIHQTDGKMKPKPSTDWERDKDFICHSCASFTYNTNGCDVGHCDCIAKVCSSTKKKPGNQDRRGLKESAEKTCCFSTQVTFIQHLPIDPGGNNATLMVTGGCQVVPAPVDNHSSQVNTYGSCVTFYDLANWGGKSLTVKEKGFKNLHDNGFHDLIIPVLRRC